MSPLSEEQIKNFQTEILTWYKENKRDLPWRKTRDPYRILISEIMLQQTQVNRVIPKFDSWLKAFPTVSKLAKAPTAEVLRLWSGLGYNRRALHLKKTAVVVSELYKGTFPNTEKALLALPGIGTYTARAILCFAFNVQVAVVDTNVRKVIIVNFFQNDGVARVARTEGSAPASEARQGWSDPRRAPAVKRGRRTGVTSDRTPSGTSQEAGTATEKEILQTAEKLLPYGNAYDWNQALMDYAAIKLKKEKITIPKQSKFLGSHRYYRGRVLKILLEKKAVPVGEVGSMIKTGFTADDQQWLDTLLNELKNEGFIEYEKKSLRLKR